MSVRFIAAGDVDTAELDDGATVVFHTPSGKFLVLNPSMALLWSELAAPRTKQELTERLCAQFPDVSPETATHDVDDGIERLRELDLVALDEEVGAQ
jgi:PqqD family protein of HPr-rel-A system